MNTRWTKLLVVVLTLAMVLSLAACGEPAETPAQTTPEQTPAATTPEATTPGATTPEASTPTATTPEATTPVETPVVTTPEATTPVETPVASTPVDTETGKEPGKDPNPPVVTTPAATDPATPTDRPDEPTWEDELTEKGNYIYILDKTTETIKVDGITEKAAYYNGIYLTAEISVPASGSYFDVFIVADDTHIYFMYEFFKEEEIFWNPSWGSKYHLDCVDFCITLSGLEALGTEFRIYGGVEGGMDAEGYFDGGAKGAGVDALYVRRTEEGYNVEFSIPLEKVLGSDANGDKMIAFTALSTITTAYDPEKTDNPYARSYTTANCAAGALDKNNPSMLVIKGTKVEGTVEPEKTADGRYLLTLTAAKESLKDKDIQAYATTNGLVMEGVHCDGQTKFLNDTNNYKAYITADAEYLYVLFDINDSNLVAPGGASYWQNDCAEIDYDVTGGTDVISHQMRVWPAAEGTNHYKADDAHTAWHAGTAGVGALDKAISDGVLESYTVTLKEGGYKVLFTFNRSAMKDNNTIAMYFSIALGDVDETSATGYHRAYVGVDSVAHAAGNSAKPYANVFKIVDAE